MTSNKMLAVIVILVLLDTALGFLGALKTHTARSSIGRLGFTQKLAEILLMLAIAFLVQLDPVNFPEPLLTGLYGGLALFEVTSVVENMAVLGLNIPWLTHYLASVPDPDEHPKQKVAGENIEAPDVQAQKLNIKK